MPPLRRASTCAIGAAVMIALCALPARAERCIYVPGRPLDELAEVALTCPDPGTKAWGDLVTRDSEGEVALLALARRRPELRPAILAAFERWDPSGRRGMRALGIQRVDWYLDGIRSGDLGADLKRLRELGRPAALRAMTELDRACAGRGIAAFDVLYTVPDPIAVDALVRLADNASCTGDSRVRAAAVVTAIDATQGVRLLNRLSREPPLAGQRGRMADALAHTTSTEGLAAAAEMLTDGSILRQTRYEAAEAMRKSGNARAIAAANRYGPSGTTGYGFPESPVGQIVAALLLLACAWAVWLRGTETTSSRWRRSGMVALMVLVTQLLFTVVRDVIIASAFLLGGPISVAGGLAAITVGTIVLVGPLARAWRVPLVTTGALSGAAALGVVLGSVVDMQVYWYEWRNEAGTFTKGLSLLELAIVVTTVLVASYVVPLCAGPRERSTPSRPALPTP